MRTRKAFKNAIFSLIYQIVFIVCGLITPKLILEAFGSTYNGVISSANQFLQMISFLTLGIAGATRVALYKPLADGDMTSVSRIIKSNKRFMRKVAIAAVGLTALLCVIYPYISHNDLSSVECSALIGIVGLGIFAQYFFGLSNQTLLSADQSVYVYHIIQTVATIINTLSAVILIRLGCNIFVVKLVSSIIFLISPVILNLVVKRKYHLLDSCEPDDSAIKNRGAVAFHSIANIIHEDTDLIVLTLFVDAKLISVYTVYQLIIGKIRSMMLMLTNGLEGAFGNIWAKKEYMVFERNFKFFEYLIFSATSVLFCCVATLILPFMSLYTSGVHDINYIIRSFALLTVLTEAMHCIRQPYLTAVQSTGNYEGTKIGALVEALINILVSLILVKPLGLNGVMIGTLVANTFRTIQYSIFVSHNIVRGSLNESIKKFVWFVANSATIILVQMSCNKILFVPNTWLAWIGLGFIFVCVALLVTFVSSFIFYKNYLFHLFRIIKRVLLRS